MNRRAMISELLHKAAQAATHAYAPYSNYFVGAAVLTDDGAIYTGCNVENASYGLSLCAERNAIAAAVAAGARRIQAVAVVSPGHHKPYPCGACRQVLAEFANAQTPVYIAHTSRLSRALRLPMGRLLPHAFAL